MDRALVGREQADELEPGAHERVVGHDRDLALALQLRAEHLGQAIEARAGSGDAGAALPDRQAQDQRHDPDRERRARPTRASQGEGQRRDDDAREHGVLHDRSARLAGSAHPARTARPDHEAREAGQREQAERTARPLVEAVVDRTTDEQGEGRQAAGDVARRAVEVEQPEHGEAPDRGEVEHQRDRLGSLGRAGRPAHDQRQQQGRAQRQQDRGGLAEPRAQRIFAQPMGVGRRPGQRRRIVDEPEQVVVVDGARQAVDRGHEQDARDDPQAAGAGGPEPLGRDHQHEGRGLGPDEHRRREHGSGRQRSLADEEQPRGEDQPGHGVGVGVAAWRGREQQRRAGEHQRGDVGRAMAELARERGDQQDPARADQQVEQQEGLEPERRDRGVEERERRSQLLEEQARDRLVADQRGEVPAQDALVVQVAAGQDGLDADQREQGCDDPGDALVP